MASRELKVEIIGDASSLNKALGKVDGQLGKTSSAFSKFGKAAVAGVAVAGAAVGAGLAVSVGKAVEFERSMRNVNTIAGLSEKQLKALEKQVLSLAGPTAQSPKTLAEGLYDIVSSGFKAKDATKILAVSAKAASAGLTDTATATKAVTASLNAYQLGAKDARKVSDILFTTVNKGVLTFEELAANMGDLVPAASPLGVSLEEVGASMATITLQGVPAAEAATRVKNTMLQLAKPSAALSGLLKEQGYASGEAAIKALGFSGVLQMLDKATKGSVTETAKLTPEIRALLGVVGLTGKNLKVYEENLLAMKGAQEGVGATSKAFAEQAKSAGFQWDRLKTLLEVTAIRIGSALLPALNEVVTAINRNWPQIEKVVDRVMDALISGATSAVAAVRRNFEAIKTVVTTAFEGALAAAKKLVAFFQTDFGQTLGIGLAAVLALKTGMGALGLSIGGVGKALMVLKGNPMWALLIPLGLLVGELAGNFIQAKIDAAQLATELDRASDNAKQLKDSLDSLKQAELTERQAKHNLAEATAAVRDAQAAVNTAYKESGPNSKQAADAVRNLEGSLLNLEQANIDVDTATKNHVKAEQARTNELTNSERKVLNLTTSVEKLQGSSLAQSALMPKYAAAMKTLGDNSAVTAAKLRETDPAASRAAAKGALLAGVAEDLAKKLGRIPTRKEIIAEAKAIKFGPFYAELLEAQQKTKKAMSQIPKDVAAVAGPAGSAAAGIGSAITSGIESGFDFGGIISIVRRGVQAAIEAGKNAGSTTEDAAKPIGHALVEGPVKGVKEKAPDLEAETKKAVANAIANTKDLAASAAKVLGGGATQEIINGIIGKSPSLTAQIRTALKDAMVAAKAEAVAKAKEIAEAIASAKDAWRTAFGSLAQAGLDAIAAKYAGWQAPSALKAQKEAEEREAKALIKAVTDAQSALNAAIVAENEAMVASISATRKEGESEEDFEKRKGELAAAATAAGAAVAAANVTVADAEFAKRQADLAKLAAEETKAHDAKIKGEQDNWLKRLRVIMREGGNMDVKIQKLLKSFNIGYLTRGEEWGNSLAEGLRNSIGEVEAAAAELAAAGKGNGGGGGGKGGAKGDPPYGKARGGPVFKGGRYIVGEQGPEMFVPKQSGSIMTASQTRRFLRGGGSGGLTKSGGPGAQGESVPAAPKWANESVWQAAVAIAGSMGKLEEFIGAVNSGSYRANAGLLNGIAQNRTRWNWNTLDAWPTVRDAIDMMLPLGQGMSGAEAAEFFGWMKKGGTLPGDGLYYGHKGETVIPLDRSMGQTVIINVTGYVGSERQLARELAPAFMEETRKRQGKGAPPITRVR